MCNMKIEAMDRAGETGEIHSTSYYDIDRNRPVVPLATLPAQYDASAMMAATRLMVDLGRTIDGAGTTTMISQAAAVLEALGRLPVVDGGVHVALTKVLRGELAAKEAECAELASRVNSPVAGSEDDLLEVARCLCSIAARRAELPDSKREHYPHVDEEGAPILMAARAACVARGYTEDGLAVEGIAYPIRPASAPSVEQIQRRQNVQGMADCMDMVRIELIEMGVIGKGVAPMFIAEAVASHIKSLSVSAPRVYRNADNERVESWNAVVDVLQELRPGFLLEQGTGEECAIRAIRALAAPVAQPLAASAVPEVSDYDMFAAWKAYPLDALDSEGRFDKDWLNREFIAFKAGRSALAAPEGDAFQKMLDAEGLRILSLYQDGKQTFAECSAMIGALAAAPRQEAQPAVQARPWVKLWDSQWVNIVNHDRCYEGMSKEDAVHLAVKLTEARLKANNEAAPSQQPAASPTEAK